MRTSSHSSEAKPKEKETQSRRKTENVTVLHRIIVVHLLRPRNTEPLSAEQGRNIRNIVLVHGAWTDGSGWKGVYDILVKDGYNVTIVQEPETSFKEDVAATKRTLARRFQEEIVRSSCDSSTLANAESSCNGCSCPPYPVSLQDAPQ
jgi:hypothetical protein